jgi:hypothetical protein
MLMLANILDFTKKHKIFLLILLAAIFVRFYNFEDRIVFGPEQAMSLSVSARYLSEKFSLLGQPYFRETSQAHTLFSGAWFNYSLILLQIFLNYDPIKITYYFSLLNLVNGILLYFLLLKISNKFAANIATFLFLFNSTMIYHSFFIWNYNYLPTVMIITLYLLFQEKKNNSVILLGLLSGVGFSLQYLYLLPGIIIFLYLLLKSKTKLKTFFQYFSGFIVGNLPLVLFDLRHNFYQTKTLVLFFLEQFSNNGNRVGFQYYHFLYLWPLFALVISQILSKIKIPKFLTYIVLATYLIFNLNSNLVSFTKAVGMPENLTTKDVLRAAKHISTQDIEKYNVAETYDFDTRANVLRYPLEYMYHKKPMDEISYQNPDTLYVLSNTNYDLANPISWELKSFMPYNSKLDYLVNEDWAVYKLTK